MNVNTPGLFVSAYYNEIDPQAAAWLRELIARGLIAHGVVDTRSIEEIKPYELRDFTQCHFLQVSACGHTPCAKPDGQTTDQCGQAVVLVSLSARQAKERDLLTSGTYGPRSTTSSASADLLLSLENRLRQKTASLGSTLYKLTWKVRTTPSGRLIPALRASVLRTSGNDCTGYPTPAARDFRDTGDLSKSRYRKDGKERKDTLPRIVEKARGSNKRLTASGETQIGFSTQTENGGPLNPSHSRWLMGLPISWDICALKAFTKLRRK